MRGKPENSPSQSQISERNPDANKPYTGGEWSLLAFYLEHDMKFVLSVAGMEPAV